MMAHVPTPEYVRPEPQFAVHPAIDGFEVIENKTGRMVDKRATKRSANGVVFKLNEAARRGPFALDGALGAR
jgi:hypothetical protein